MLVMWGLMTFRQWVHVVGFTIGQPYFAAKPNPIVGDHFPRKESYVFYTSNKKVHRSLREYIYLFTSILMRTPSLTKRVMYPFLLKNAGDKCPPKGHKII